MIVAHHFVVSSKLFAGDGPMVTSPYSANTIFLYIFGMWGKTGIDCFLLITGYFMCKSKITLRKFFKLLIYIYIYKIALYAIFAICGYSTISLSQIAYVMMPFNGFVSRDFPSCFLAFWLTIPFWNILIKNLTQVQHALLTGLLLFFYTILGSIPGFHITFNYITWFGVIYLISSYIRLYPSSLLQKHRLWGMLSLVSICIAIVSLLVMHYFAHIYEFFFVADSNKIFAVTTAVSSFLWFKGLNIPYKKWINVIGGSTFGVLLIHNHSDAMRRLLWEDLFNCAGDNFNLPLGCLILFCVVSVLIVFSGCSLIEIVREKTIEKWFFKWYDTKIGVKLEDKLVALINKLSSILAS
jgi:hypothetical protein